MLMPMSACEQHIASLIEAFGSQARDERTTNCKLAIVKFAMRAA